MIGTNFKTNKAGKACLHVVTEHERTPKNV